VPIHYAREEVPEVLKFTPATAVPGSAAAEANAAQAAMRPLAGFGAGAFTCDGAFVGSGANGLAASSAQPLIRGAAAATGSARAQAHGRGCGGHRLGTVGGSSVGISSVRKSPVGVGTISTSNGRTSNGRTSNVHTSTVGTSSVGTQQFDLMARINPVTPGGLGPHPAREPGPV
jgi:hypothetical protein